MKNLLILVCILIILYLVYQIKFVDYYETQNEDTYTRYLANKIRYLDPRINRIFDKLSFHDGKNRSFTLNKRNVHLCKVDKEGKLYEQNQLMLVMIHEIAHCICTDVGHTENFNIILDELLEKASQQGLYNPNMNQVEDYCTY